MVLGGAPLVNYYLRIYDGQHNEFLEKYLVIMYLVLFFVVWLVIVIEIMLREMSVLRKPEPKLNLVSGVMGGVLQI
jgi:hypothetical protein